MIPKTKQQTRAELKLAKQLKRRDKKMAKLKLDFTFKEVTAKIKELLLEGLDAALPPETAIELAVDKAVLWLDDRINYGPGPIGLLIDSVDHILMRALLRLLVKEVYEELDKLTPEQPSA